jgi:hypothetical protein
VTDKFDSCHLRLQQSSKGQQIQDPQRRRSTTARSNNLASVAMENVE